MRLRYSTTALRHSAAQIAQTGRKVCRYRKCGNRLMKLFHRLTQTSALAQKMPFLNFIFGINASALA